MADSSPIRMAPTEVGDFFLMELGFSRSRPSRVCANVLRGALLSKIIFAVYTLYFIVDIFYFLRTSTFFFFFVPVKHATSGIGLRYYQLYRVKYLKRL